MLIPEKGTLASFPSPFLCERFNEKREAQEKFGRIVVTGDEVRLIKAGAVPHKALAVLSPLYAYIDEPEGTVSQQTGSYRVSLIGWQVQKGTVTLELLARLPKDLNLVAHW